MLVSMDITCAGTNGYLRLYDFVIPFQEKVASFYEASSSRFANLALGCEPNTNAERAKGHN